MSGIDIRKVVHEELNNIAPEADLASVDPAADLREVIDIDSMDFLNFVIGLGQRSGLNIPEADTLRLRTMRGLVAYLSR